MKTDTLTSAYMDIRGKLHRMATRLLSDDEEAKDAVQDAFEKLWTNDEIQSGDEARNKLVRVLHNACIDRLRGRHTVSLEAVGAVGERSYEAPYEDMAQYERLILRGLTDLQLRIYGMITHDCMEYGEVAGVLGMKVEAVRMNMSRARRRISENLKAIER